MITEHVIPNQGLDKKPDTQMNEVSVPLGCHSPREGLSPTQIQGTCGAVKKLGIGPPKMKSFPFPPNIVIFCKLLKTDWRSQGCEITFKGILQAVCTGCVQVTVRRKQAAIGRSLCVY